MFHLAHEFSCTSCGHIIDVGEPFLANATYPARAFSRDEAVDSQFLQNQGEVLCQSCTIKRIGADASAKLMGTVFMTTPTKKKTSK